MERAGMVNAYFRPQHEIYHKNNGDRSHRLCCRCFNYSHFLASCHADKTQQAGTEEVDGGRHRNRNYCWKQ